MLLLNLVATSDLVVPCDTVSMCLSKGVGAPAAVY